MYRLANTSTAHRVAISTIHPTHPQTTSTYLSRNFNLLFKNLLKVFAQRMPLHPLQVGQTAVTRNQSREHKWNQGLAHSVTKLLISVATSPKSDSLGERISSSEFTSASLLPHLHLSDYRTTPCAQTQFLELPFVISLTNPITFQLKI